MGQRGPKPVSAEGIQHLATWFYRDLRGLAEGTSREWFNQRSFKEEIRNEWAVDDTDRAHIVGVVDEEIKTGQLNKDQQQERLRSLEAGLALVKQMEGHRAAADHAWEEKKVRGEADVLKRLLQAKNAKQIHCICADAHGVRRAMIWGEEKDIHVSNWPIESGSLFPEYLARFAD